MYERNARTAAAVNWSYRPVRPLMTEVGDIYITRIVPKTDHIQVFWMVEDAVVADLYWRKRGEGEYSCIAGVKDGAAVIPGLEDGVDYEFYLQDEAGHKSLTRLARTGDYIGVTIQYLHPEDTAYAYSGSFLGNPTVIRHPDGFLLANVDVFGKDTPQNLTFIFRSDDDGATWQWQCELYPCFWGQLFVYRGEVYMLSCSTEHGDILIGKTLDGGKTFTAPTVLIRGSGRKGVDGPDTDPQPPVEYNGRLWINFHWGCWPKGKHHACIASAPADSDLLDAANWTFGAPCVYDENWPGAAKGKSRGTLEGTFVILPDEKLYILARYEIKECVPDYGLAVLYRVNTDDPSAPLEFARTVPFDGNHSKFTVVKDEQTGWYYSIIARIRGSEFKNDRNLLSLIRSKDGIQWELVKDLIDMTHCDPKKVGMQYTNLFIEGEDIYYACRAAFNGAGSFHDGNNALFDVIHDFRSLS